MTTVMDQKAMTIGTDALIARLTAATGTVVTLQQIRRIRKQYSDQIGPEVVGPARLICWDERQIATFVSIIQTETRCGRR